MFQLNFVESLLWKDLSEVEGFFKLRYELCDESMPQIYFQNMPFESNHTSADYQFA